MPVKSPNKISHRTATGKEFNMDQFRQKHELTPAVGNIKVNARGDELGAGGKIVRKRSEVIDEYYSGKVKSDETPVKQSQPAAKAKPPTKASAPAATPAPTKAPTPTSTPAPKASVDAKTTSSSTTKDSKNA